MPKLKINGIELEVPAGANLLQACEAAGAEIPRFCYHEKLAIAGNCRMCLVEVEKSPKPVASCAQPVTEGMVVHTDSPMVKKAREGVMEFLLINHPLDCPICDQGGECDLQDQAMKYGKGYSQFKEEKRAVLDKYMGPLISTNMNRCIHCTRCVRFLEDIAGTNELGAIGRGEEMEITTYVERSISSELSGNIIDLCPVGALTAKPYAFQFRSWELKKTHSIDVMDGVGSNISIGVRGIELMRILPNRNDEINEEWISDKTRFAFDGLKYQRLDTPMIKMNGKLEICDWNDAFSVIKDRLLNTNSSKIGAVAGSFIDTEGIFAAKQFFDNLGIKSYDCREDGSLLNNEERWLYKCNSTIAGIEEMDVILIVGSNPRHEAAALNTRIRKAFLKNNAKIALIGEKVDLNYNYKHLGNNPWILKQLAEEEHSFAQEIKNAKKPGIIVSASVFARSDFEAFLYYLKKICVSLNIIRSDWNGFNVLQRTASIVGGLDLGFIPEDKKLGVNDIVKNSEILFLIGADEIDTDLISKRAFVVYQGHHGDRSINRADVILPAAAFTEKDGTYVNTEGRVQRAYQALPALGLAKSDWEIFNDLSIFIGNNQISDSLMNLRSAMNKRYPIFQDLKMKKDKDIKIVLGRKKSFEQDFFESPIKNFYITNSISRNSKNMARCTQEILYKNVIK